MLIFIIDISFNYLFTLFNVTIVKNAHHNLTITEKNIKYSQQVHVLCSEIMTFIIVYHNGSVEQLFH